MSSLKSRTAVFKNVQTPTQKYGAVGSAKVAKPTLPVESTKYEIKKNILYKSVDIKPIVAPAINPVESVVVKPVIVEPVIVKPVIVEPVVESIVIEPVIVDPVIDQIVEQSINPVVLSLEKVNELLNTNVVIEND
jgi:hypothetical protein